MPRILRLHSYSGLDGLSLDDVPLQEPGDGLARISVLAFALNWGDMDLMENNYSFEFESMPARIGSEAIGIVDAVGAGVSSSLVGQRVCTIPYFYGANGVNGEFALVPEDFLTPVPEALSDIEACSVWMQYLTAYFPLVEIGQIGPASIVLITAATGSAGLGAIQIARMLGSRTVCTTRSNKNRAFLLDAGADQVVVTTSEDLLSRLDEITAGEGVNLVYDPVGGSLVASYAKALAQDAVIVLYGGLSGERTVLPELELTARNASLHPYSMMNYTARPECRARGIKFVRDALASGDLLAGVDRSFCLDDYRDAFEYMRSKRRAHGKVVIAIRERGPG